MQKKIYIVTDLGPGDGGKGSIVHYLAQKIDADIVIKRGGAQGSHGVRTAAGESFNFSQWGCGTLNAIPSYCSAQMVLSPVGLRNEAEWLERLGIYDPFRMLSVDPSCICATPFHQIASQLEELLRRDSPRGTIGTGVGQAYRLSQWLDESFTIRATELTDRVLLCQKLSRQLNYYRDKYANVTVRSVLDADTELVQGLLELLADDGYLDFTVDLFEAVGRKLHLQELPEVLSQYNNIVVECSHGVLTDAETGFKPHVSAIRTLPKFTEVMFRSAGYDGEIINLVVHRAYEIRHGAGPMPTYDPEYTNAMLPDSHKANNRWQGDVRIGALDLPLMHYALDNCHDTRIDGICLTWFDQILKTDRDWRICTHYNNGPSISGGCTVFLKSLIEPNIKSIHIDTGISQAEIFSKVASVIHEQLGLNLSILSLGPTEQDKVCSSLYV